MTKLITISTLKNLSWKMPKPIPISRLMSLSRKAKIGLALGLVVVISLIALAIIWLTVREVWVEQPVMLRILKGETEIYTVHQGEFLGSADETWLDAGNCVIVKQDGLAVLQYHDGSAIKVEGPGEVHVSWSKSIDGQPLNKSRSIGLEVLRGKVTVAAARQTAPSSLFELQTPNSVGVVQGTMFEVEVNERKQVFWEMSGGTVKVAAIAVGGDLRAVVALLPLKAGDAVAIPRLPEEWREKPATTKKLITTASDVARKSVEEDLSDIKVRRTTLLASNPVAGTAVFRAERVTKPAAGAATALQIAPDYKAWQDKTLAGMMPGLVVAKAPKVKRLFIPALPTPEVWSITTPPVVRESPPTYLFSIYDLAKPLGVAVDPVDQRIYATESEGNRVTRVFDREGNQTMVLAPPNTVPAGRTPTYVAVDRMGTVYVSDRMRHTIDMYDVNGIYLGAFTPRNNPGISWSPLCLAFDSIGNFYVTDVSSLKHRVMVFDSSDELKLEFGKEGGGEGEFAFPNDVAVDSNGQIYVADSNNFRIQVFDAQGQPLGAFTRAGGEVVGFPRGMEIEGDYLYIVDTFGHTVRVYNLNEGAKPVFYFGRRGIGDGEFNFPNGLALDPTGRLYITDRENNRLQVWGY